MNFSFFILYSGLPRSLAFSIHLSSLSLSLSLSLLGDALIVAQPLSARRIELETLRTSFGPRCLGLNCDPLVHHRRERGRGRRVGGVPFGPFGPHGRSVPIEMLVLVCSLASLDVPNSVLHVVTGSRVEEQRQGGGCSESRIPSPPFQSL